MHFQQRELLAQLPKHGWRIASVEEDLEWWADEMWMLESVWSPVESCAYVTFLVDPQSDVARKKGQAVWAVMVTPGKPKSWSGDEGKFTLPLGHDWKEGLPDLFKHLSGLRDRHR